MWVGIFGYSIIIDTKRLYIIDEKGDKYGGK